MTLNQNCHEHLEYCSSLMIVVVEEEIDEWKIAKSLQEVKLRRALGFSHLEAAINKSYFCRPAIACYDKMHNRSECKDAAIYKGSEVATIARADERRVSEYRAAIAQRLPQRIWQNASVRIPT